MKYKLKIIFHSTVLSIMLVLTMCSSCKSDINTINYQNKVYKTGDKIVITGLITRVGNEPFTHLVIIDDNGMRFSMNRNSEEMIEEIKSVRITVTGILKVDKLVTADGKKTTLTREITVTSVVNAD